MQEMKEILPYALSIAAIIIATVTMISERMK